MGGESRGGKKNQANKNWDIGREGEKPFPGVGGGGKQRIKEIGTRKEGSDQGRFKQRRGKVFPGEKTTGEKGEGKEGNNMDTTKKMTAKKGVSCPLNAFA